MYDLKVWKVILKKAGLAGKYSMIKYREDWPVPDIKHARQIKAKTRIAGICTSDIHQINVNLPYSASILARKENPFPMGHELVGEVVEVGDEAGDFLNPLPPPAIPAEFPSTLTQGTAMMNPAEGDVLALISGSSRWQDKHNFSCAIFICKVSPLNFLVTNALL